MSDQSAVTIMAKTLGRQPNQIFGIKPADRLSHVLALGKTGTGKSVLIQNMILQDIAAGRGVCLLDPHGDLVEAISQQIPSHRYRDLIYMNVPKVPNVYGYNPLRYVRSEKRSLAAAGILDVFKKQWADSWGVRLEHILRNCILTLLEFPNSNIADILHLLTDRQFRESLIQKLSNNQVRYFWENEYAKYSPPFRLNAIAPIQNKVSAFLTDPIIKQVIIDPPQDLSFRQIMDDRKVLLVNLAKGLIGSDTSSLIGSLLLTTIAMAAFSRQDAPVDRRPDFMLYMDEFQHFTTLAIADMASELRKYRCGLMGCTQFLDQMQPDVRNAMIGNAGTLLSFRLGASDAVFISREFQPTFNRADLVRLPNFHLALRLMIDGEPTKPFSAVTLPPTIH